MYNFMNKTLFYKHKIKDTHKIDKGRSVLCVFWFMRKEVVSVEEGRYIGHVRDLEFDPVCGKICAIIVPGPGKYMGEYFAGITNIVFHGLRLAKIGPDIILVNICESDMRRKLL